MLNYHFYMDSELYKVIYSGSWGLPGEPRKKGYTIRIYGPPIEQPYNEDKPIDLKFEVFKEGKSVKETYLHLDKRPPLNFDIIDLKDIGSKIDELIKSLL